MVPACRARRPDHRRLLVHEIGLGLRHRMQTAAAGELGPAVETLAGKDLA
jgi:hypothetical protein